MDDENKRRRLIIEFFQEFEEQERLEFEEQLLRDIDEGKLYIRLKRSIFRTAFDQDYAAMIGNNPGEEFIISFDRGINASSVANLQHSSEDEDAINARQNFAETEAARALQEIAAGKFSVEPPNPNDQHRPAN